MANEKTMTYKEIAKQLCDGFRDMPSGCEGCPLFDEDFLDEEGNMICELNRAKGGAVMTNVEALECFESDCETCQFKGRDCKSCRTKVAISALRREIKNQSDCARPSSND